MTNFPNNILVIGDAHVTDRQSLRRFDWLAEYVRTHGTNLTHCIIIGDFLSLNALSAWDRDKRLLMEGRRLFKEISSGRKAVQILTDALDPKVKKIFIEGNHENRLTRYVETHPELEAKEFTVEQLLALGELGWEWVPYKKYKVVGGIHFTHIPFGKMREITGKDICSKAEAVTIHSTVFGHTHELHTSCVHKHGMKHLQQILNCGCFFEQSEEYVEGKMTNYWKGVVRLNNYEYGRFDLETTSMSQLERAYKTRESHAAAQ